MEGTKRWEGRTSSRGRRKGNNQRRRKEASRGKFFQSNSSSLPCGNPFLPLSRGTAALSPPLLFLLLLRAFVRGREIGDLSSSSWKSGRTNGQEAVGTDRKEKQKPLPLSFFVNRNQQGWVGKERRKGRILPLSTS